MKKGKLLALVGGICIVLILAAAPVISACAAPAPAPAPAPTPAPAPAPAPAPTPTPETITLKSVTFLPQLNPWCKGFFAFADKVNERAKGELVIEYIGGPEAISGYEQASAVRSGVVDISFLPGTMYAGLVAVGGMLELSQLTPAEEREQAYDFLLQQHEKSGLFLLGRFGPAGDVFYLFTNKRVQTPYDLAGQKIGPGTMARLFIESLGGIPVVLKIPEMYTAMERGVVDGLTYTFLGYTQFGLHEVTKYFIDHPFLQSTLVTIVNPDTWNGLPKHLQDLMIEATMEVEREFPEEYSGMEVGIRQACLDAGVEIIEFSPADAEWFVKRAYSAQWEKQMEDYPEIAPKLKELFSK